MKIVKPVFQAASLILFLWFLFPQEMLSDLEKKTLKIVNTACSLLPVDINDEERFQNALEHDPRLLDAENELYIFSHVYDKEKKEAVCWAHGVRTELIGKNMWSLRTPNGRLLFHEFIEMIEEKGSGWIEYDWLNPYTDRLQTKRSFLRGVVLYDGRKAWVACGFWK